MATEDRGAAAVVVERPSHKTAAPKRRVALRRIGSVAVAVLVLAALGAYLFVQRTLPTVDGTLRVAGLLDRVEVLRDRWGVPHIYAQNARDAYFTQGYVTAQDRLWQMELFRRAASGTLAEIFGKIALEQDQLVRTLGLRRVALREAAQLDVASSQILDAYADGVNAFVITHRDRLPLEFSILGFRPEPWAPVDSLAFAKIMAMDLSGNWEHELLRAKLLARFGAEGLRELAPTYPQDAPIVVPSEIAFQSFAGTALSDTGRFVHPFGKGAGVGSNSWVVDGSLTASGRPLLANDPHLDIQMPALWYQVHLSAPSGDVASNLDVIGASLPGVPGVVIGHNDRIAWGMTNLGADVQDLFVEKINPDNPLQYEYRGQWQDIQTREETIKVRGEAEPVKLAVLATRHGPLLNGVVKGLGQPVALRWTALEPGRSFRALMAVDYARDWDDFREALRDFVVPAQNFVYADVFGNIGYLAPGVIPIRAKGDGLLPVPGWTGEYEWIGQIPFDELPSAYNPPEHYLFTANNRVVDDRYPYFITYDWNPGYRARRVAELIQGQTKFDASAFQRMQLDTKSPPLVELAGLLSGLPAAPAGADRLYLDTALRYIRDWDGHLDADSVGGAILEVTLTKLLANVYADAMGPELFKEYADTEWAVPSVLGVGNRRSYWFASVRTAAQPGREEVALKSLRDAVGELRRRLGDDVSSWRWGRLHTATFGHPLGQLKPLDRLFDLGPYPVAGSRNVLNQAAYLPSKGFGVSKLASLREIVDLADLDRSLFVATSGQSGQPLSKHFGDLAELWRRGEYHPLLFSRQQIEAQREGRLVLTP